MKNQELCELGDEGFFAALPSELAHKLHNANSEMGIHSPYEEDYELRANVFVDALNVQQGPWDVYAVREQRIVESYNVQLVWSGFDTDSLTCEQIAKVLIAVYQSISADLETIPTCAPEPAKRPERPLSLRADSLVV